MKQKMFTEGRVRMEEHGGRLFLEETVSRRGEEGGGGGEEL